MVGLAENHAIHMLAEDIFRFSLVRRVRTNRSYIVCDTDLEPVQIFHTGVGEGRKIEVKIVSTDRKDLTIIPGQTREHFFALQIAGVDHDIGVLEQIEHSFRNGVFALPVRIGQDCNSHGDVPPSRGTPCLPLHIVHP
jgi:hypothetical protein